MPVLDPNDIFQGTLLIVAPHMDDEALACGGLIARLAQKERIYIVYATDGMKSPAPILPRIDSISPDLGETRIAESIAAMKSLGIPERNLHFFRLPEANLKKEIPTLTDLLANSIKSIRPDSIFIPFRYDRHPDHLTINQVITKGSMEGWCQAQLVEYFVYYRWRLLPTGDIRSYIKPDRLIEIGIEEVAIRKRKALDLYKSQTTIHYPWQTRPILTPQLLDDECRGPEYFLIHDPSMPGTAVFSKNILWIRLVHRLEPFLQKQKYLAGASLKRLLRRNARHAG